MLNTLKKFKITIACADGTNYLPRIKRGNYLDAFTLCLPSNQNSTGLTGEHRFTPALAVQIWGEDAHKAVAELERDFARSDPFITLAAHEACVKALGLNPSPKIQHDIDLNLRSVTANELHWSGALLKECQDCGGTGSRESADSADEEPCDNCDWTGKTIDIETDFVTNWEGRLQ
jgi:hypothetical protein